MAETLATPVGLRCQVMDVMKNMRIIKPFGPDSIRIEVWKCLGVLAVECLPSYSMLY